jgi:2'-hydroxyisoflavone reductase
MSTRRSFLRTVAGFEPPVAQAPRAMRILILGGTGFIGPHMVDYAVRRGHQVSIFTRGRREPTLFEASFANVEHLVGDRAQPDGLDALRGKQWDAVIDNSGQSVEWTRDSAQLLRNAVRLYLYISSTGVYWTPSNPAGYSERDAVSMRDDPPLERPSYGVMKALSEEEARKAFPSGAIALRPHYIVGPGDTTDRFPYWPVRIHAGGEVLAPGTKADPVQYVDVRDLAEFTIHLLENGTTGTFNVVGPLAELSMAEFLYGIRSVTQEPVDWVWIDDYQFLRSYPFNRSQDGSTSGLTAAVPWLLPDGDLAGVNRMSNAAAVAAGLRYRPLADTSRDTLEWWYSDAVPQTRRDQPRFALDREREAAMIAAWRDRGSRG